MWARKDYHLADKAQLSARVRAAASVIWPHSPVLVETYISTHSLCRPASGIRDCVGMDGFAVSYSGLKGVRARISCQISNPHLGDFQVGYCCSSSSIWDSVAE